MYRIIPMILVMGIIFFLSHRPGDSFDLPSIVNIDKLLHCLVYAVLGTCACYAVPIEWWERKSRKVMFGVIMFCLFYGVTDEVHQWFIPGRYPSGADLIADLVGGSIAVLGYRLYLARAK